MRDAFIADLRMDGLAATRTVAQNDAIGFPDLAEYVGQLAVDWRGWRGTRAWESLEGDLRIEARHAYGHVQLGITLRLARAGWGNHGWTATGDVTIEPGEQLTRVAGDLRALAVWRCGGALRGREAGFDVAVLFSSRTRPSDHPVHPVTGVA